jgi:hypothetical protein
MTAMDTRSLPSLFGRNETSRSQLLRRMQRGLAKMAAWLSICAEYHAAAAQYEELSRLSDAELNRRGLSRDTLARDICESADRAGKP